MSGLLLAASLEAEVTSALGTVSDPELDEPITDLGFVRSIAIDESGVTVHLRLPSACCSPNFAYLMTTDAVDALRQVEGIGEVRVLLDGHQDSASINGGLAADAGYRETVGAEVEAGLDDQREVFQRKAHLAAMERCVEDRLKNTGLTLADVYRLRLRNLPSGRFKEALLRRRAAVGLSIGPEEPVLVDADGTPVPPDQLPVRLRFAKSARNSAEGSSHFCRSLLATRSADTEGLAIQITNTRRPRRRTS